MRADWSGKNSSVFAVEGGKAKKIYVQAGVQDHTWVEVLAKSLPEGTQLIQDVRDGVNDGMLVRAQSE